MKLRKALRFAIATACVAWFSQLTTPAEASVVIGGTRVIYARASRKSRSSCPTRGKRQRWCNRGSMQAT
ncbi:hypothetical protein [Burkholderia gladioli]|uniref:hypothetical protein n=1 Tax=Burkholderia gladioli TaxID=28095 RepID=UPI0034DAF111